MLIRFNVKNFLSFSTQEDGSAEEFSMIAGKVRSKNEHIYEDKNIKLLKFAAVYGANASGKSNLVKAMDFMKKTVIDGLPVGHTEKYCKVKPENKEKPSYFEIEIMLGKKYYAYGFEVILSQSKFISEWLVELTADNKEKIIFTRNVQKGDFQLGSRLQIEGLKARMNIYADDIREDGSALLLYALNDKKDRLYEEFKKAKVIKDVYSWIEENWEIYYPDSSVSNYSYIVKEERYDEICQIISAFGTGIKGYKFIDIPIEKAWESLSKELREEVLENLEIINLFMEENEELFSGGSVVKVEQSILIFETNREKQIACKTFRFAHGENNVLFSLSEESDGTRRLLDLLEILLTAESKTYVIDELDRCLHPSLSYKFIETFMERAAKRNVQLIVTTHESRLMDFDLLRRDEIWFVEKNKIGESHMYSLEEYNERFDKKIDKAYLEGRYGGVPIFSTIFPVKED